MEFIECNITFFEVLGWLMAAFTLLRLLASIIISLKAPNQKYFFIKYGAFNELVLDYLGNPDIAISKVNKLTASKSVNSKNKQHQNLAKISENTSVNKEYFRDNDLIRQRRTEIKDKYKNGQFAASVDVGTFAAAETWQRWSAIDHHVVLGASRYFNETIDSTSDLVKKLMTGDDVNAPSFLHSLKGHVGEQHVFDHLNQAQVPFIVPDAGNHPGNDLYIDGKVGLNVKTHANVAKAFSEHSANYDSSIIVPHDATNIPDHGVLNFDPSHGIDPELLMTHKGIIVDHALSLSDVTDQTQDAIDLANHPAPHAHFPWITASVSGFREVNLLIDGHTDLGRAATNVAIDTAAVGAGGAIGGKIGAAIGTMLLPGLGTAIGGVFGSMVGGMTGRQLGNSIKRAPLEAAHTAYQESLARLTSEKDRITKDVANSWQAAQSNESINLKKTLLSLSDQLSTETESMRASLNQILRPSKDDLKLVLEHSFQSATSLYNSEISKFRNEIKWWQQVLPELLAYKTAFQIRSLKRDFAKLKNAKENLEKSPEISAESAFDFILATPAGLQLVGQHLSSCKTGIERFYGDIDKTYAKYRRRALDCRAQAVNSLKKSWNNIKERADMELSLVISRFKAAEDNLIAEMRKAGITSSNKSVA